MKKSCYVRILVALISFDYFRQRKKNKRGFLPVNLINVFRIFFYFKLTKIIKEKLMLKLFSYVHSDRCELYSFKTLSKKSRR